MQMKCSDLPRTPREQTTFSRNLHLRTIRCQPLLVVQGQSSAVLRPKERMKRRNLSRNLPSGMYVASCERVPGVFFNVMIPARIHTRLESLLLPCAEINGILPMGRESTYRVDGFFCIWEPWRFFQRLFVHAKTIVTGPNTLYLPFDSI